MDIDRLFHRIKYAEWASIAISAILQVTWVLSTSAMDQWQYLSLFSLGALFLMATVPVEKLGQKQRLVLMLAECVFATSAMFFGAHRLYGLLFLVLAGKIAMVLDRPFMLVVAFFLTIIHTVTSFAIRSHLLTMHNLAPPLPLDHHAANLVNIEAQLFSICAMVIAMMFGRTMLAELASRRAAERLGKEIEEMAVAVERSRIARDMHDTIGHSLTSLNIQLELTSKLLASGDNEEAANSLNLAREAARMSLADVRNTVRSIREEDFSLEQSVQAITERIAKQQEIAFEVKIDEKNLSSPCRHNLLMILQECLTNIQKHSQASKVTIELDASPREAHLTVRDNGKGFHRNGLGTGCGIKGMEERAISLGGAVDISSKPGSGTAVVVKLPT